MLLDYRDHYYFQFLDFIVEQIPIIKTILKLNWKCKLNSFVHAL